MKAPISALRLRSGPRRLAPGIQGLGVALLCACARAPIAPLPQPLPETLAWATAAAEERTGAFLGLHTRENVGGSLEALDLSPGLRVTRVVENSPAAEAGFEVGDVLLAFGETETNDAATLDACLLRSRPDTEEPLRARRGDTVFSVTVRLRETGASATPEAEVLFRMDPTRSRAGWVSGRGGVVLVCSSPEGPFPAAGIPVRSVVTTLDGAEMLSDRALIRELQSRDPGTRVAVEFLTPTGESREADVRLQEQQTRVTRFKVPILVGYEADAEGEESSFTLLDLWLIWLFHYERQGAERHWSFLRFFRFSTGVGELAE